MPLPDPDRGPEFKADGEVEPVPERRVRPLIGWVLNTKAHIEVKWNLRLRCYDGVSRVMNGCGEASSYPSNSNSVIVKVGSKMSVNSITAEVDVVL
jgi:hypothetical protein